jgi:predicted nuclease of restriction endonuclease-like (RecB) superfamily
MADIIKHSAGQFSENFEELVIQIKSIGEALQQDARVVINRNITTKAWLTGYYIVEYEQHGNDRAKYGDNLLQNLSKRLGGKSYSATNLRSYRLFYKLYPELRPVLARYLFERFGKDKVESASTIFLPSQIQQSLIAELQDEGKQQSVTAKSAKEHNSLIVTGISPDGFAMRFSDGSVKTAPQALFDRLSFTHIVQLLHVEDSMQREFYAIEAMRGPWSVRELQRQIDTNYYARSGWSKKSELLSKKINLTAERQTFEQDVKSPYYFEFLGLSSKDIIDENDLEAAIVSHLKDFIMELGMGFCLEEEQKRLLIDDRYYKADLVFYHRILKCHCIVELKAHRLNYADVAQLNMYIEYYRKHYMQPDDYPPVGLLLCTEYGQEMVEYLTPFTDPQLFIARYELQLPSKEKIRHFLMQENGKIKK